MASKDVHAQTANDGTVKFVLLSNANGSNTSTDRDKTVLIKLNVLVWILNGMKNHNNVFLSIHALILNILGLLVTATAWLPAKENNTTQTQLWPNVDVIMKV